MKTLFLSLLALCIFSCTSKKAKIVEREKAIKEQMETIDLRLKYMPVDTLINNPDLITTLATQKADLQTEYDSLEMELKKY